MAFLFILRHSFCTILIMWGNHHEVFRLVRKTSPGFMLANGFLLMLVTVVPFTTALISDYLTKAGAVVACAVYGEGSSLSASQTTFCDTRR